MPVLQLASKLGLSWSVQVADETKTAIAALLLLGSDLPQLDEDDTAENAQLVPINPVMMKTADDLVPSSSASSAKKETKPTKPSPSVRCTKGL